MFSVLCTETLMQGCDNYREVQRIYGGKLACTAIKGVSVKVMLQGTIFNEDF